MKYLIGLITGILLGATQAGAVPFTKADLNSPSTNLIDSNLPDAMQHMVKAPTIDYANLRDPFASYLARVATHNPIIFNPTASHKDNRKREKLESFDLDALRLVAIFSMGGERVAMIEDSRSKGYIIRQGSYLGKNNGKIEKITNDTVFLVEEVRNAARDIIDRQVSLTLNEVNE